MRLVSFLFLISIFSKVVAQDLWTKEASVEFNNSMIDFLESKNQEYLMELDSIREASKISTPISEEDLLIFKRCKLLTKTIPLDYNDQVKVYIDKYISQNYRPYMNRLFGLSKHYFPVYESILKASGVPEEVKFLSLIESSLDPHLVSTSGAVGPWQFMYITAKEFNLEMNNFVDERKDIYSSSYALSQYILDAYNQFGDWLVALASYNCGRGCVKRAIERSGIENPTFWELAPYLPQETKNYIPKYIAMTYVLSDPSYYGISAVSTELDLDHQVIFADKTIKLSNVAQAIGISQEELRHYNPSFKKDIITGSPERPKRLLLPITPTFNDSLLYLALNDIANDVIIENEQLDSSNPIKYKGKKGDTLYSLSRKFGVSVQDLKVWNNLGNSTNVLGKTLVVSKPIDSKLAKNVKTIAATKKSNVVYYTVRSGDSLDRIANKHKGLTVSKLKADNGLKSNLIKPGMRLKINKG